MYTNVASSNAPILNNRNSPSYGRYRIHSQLYTAFPAGSRRDAQDRHRTAAKLGEAGQSRRGPRAMR